LSVGSRWDHGGIGVGFALGYPAAANSRQQVASRQQFNSRLGIHVRHSCCCATTRYKEKGSEKTVTEVKDVPRQNGTDVVGLDKHREDGAPFIWESDANTKTGRLGHPPSRRPAWRKQPRSSLLGMIEWRRKRNSPTRLEIANRIRECRQPGTPFHCFCTVLRQKRRDCDGHLRSLQRLAHDECN